MLEIKIMFGVKVQNFIFKRHSNEGNFKDW